MKTKKFLLVAVFALFGAFNVMTTFATKIPPVNIICDRPQAGQGQCFEEVPGWPGDCRWTGYTNDYC